MFDGLMSRWMTPAPCAASSAHGDLSRDLERLAQSERRPALPRRQVLAVEPLHGDVRDLFEFSARDQLDDVRVVELLEQLALAQKRVLLRRLDPFDRDELERHPLRRFRDRTPVDDADPAAPHLALDLKPAAEKRAIGQRRRLHYPIRTLLGEHGGRHPPVSDFATP